MVYPVITFGSLFAIFGMMICVDGWWFCRARFEAAVCVKGEDYRGGWMKLIDSMVREGVGKAGRK